jgi:hypothetical protein
MVNHPLRSKKRTWHAEARRRLNEPKKHWNLPRIQVGSDLHLLEMALSERGKLVEALGYLADVVETALDAGLFLSVDGKRPDVPALRIARDLLAEG